MGRNATSKIGVNAVTGRGYNPSVFLHPKGAKIQLPPQREARARSVTAVRYSAFRIPHYSAAHLNYSIIHYYLFIK